MFQINGADKLVGSGRCAYTVEIGENVALKRKRSCKTKYLIILYNKIIFNISYIDSKHKLRLNNIYIAFTHPR